MSEAKATHPRVLHQPLALWAKGMTGEAVQAPILSLNDRCSLGEITVTAFGRERVSALNPHGFRPRHDVKVPTFFKQDGGNGIAAEQAALGELASARGLAISMPDAIPSTTSGVTHLYWLASRMFRQSGEILKATSTT